MKIKTKLQNEIVISVCGNDYIKLARTVENKHVFTLEFLSQRGKNERQAFAKVHCLRSTLIALSGNIRTLTGMAKYSTTECMPVVGQMTWLEFPNNTSIVLSIFTKGRLVIK